MIMGLPYQPGLSTPQLANHRQPNGILTVTLPLTLRTLSISIKKDKQHQILN